MLEIFSTLERINFTPFQRVNRSMTWKQSYCTFPLLLRILEACFSDVKMGKTIETKKTGERRKIRDNTKAWNDYLREKDVTTSLNVFPSLGIFHMYKDIRKKEYSFLIISKYINLLIILLHYIYETKNQFRLDCNKYDLFLIKIILFKEEETGKLSKLF